MLHAWCTSKAYSAGASMASTKQNTKQNGLCCNITLAALLVIQSVTNVDVSKQLGHSCSFHAITCLCSRASVLPSVPNRTFGQYLCLIRCIAMPGLHDVISYSLMLQPAVHDFRALDEVLFAYFNTCYAGCRTGQSKAYVSIIH